MAATPTPAATPAESVTEPKRRRPLSGIRARIVLGYVALLAAALTIAVLVTRQALITRLYNDIDEELVHEIEELRALVATGVDPATGEPLGSDVEAIFRTFFDRNVPGDSEAYYALVDGRPFGRYGLEQQAEIIRHRFLAQQGHRTAALIPHDFLPFNHSVTETQQS